MVFGSGQSPVMGRYSSAAEDISPQNTVFEVFYKKRIDLASDSGAGMVGDGFSLCQKIYKELSPKKAPFGGRRLGYDTQSLPKIQENSNLGNEFCGRDAIHK